MSDPEPLGPRVSSLDPTEQHPPLHLPRPTMWPAVMAAGITLLMAGLLLSLLFSLAGLLLFALALAGWIGELTHA